MSFVYGLPEFKAKLKTCESASDVALVYSVISDQLTNLKKETIDLKEKAAYNEERLREINVEDYKAAMVDRVREISGK